MQMNNDKVRSPESELPSVIFHWSLVIFFLSALSGREKKCIAGFQPAKVVLTQKELSRLRCRRDAGATIFSRDPCLRGETGRLATAGSLSESQPRSARDGVELPPRPVRGAGVHVGLQGEVPIACSLERKRYCIL